MCGGINASSSYCKEALSLKAEKDNAQEALHHP
jgi:hypothetical protein